MTEIFSAPEPLTQSLETFPERGAYGRATEFREGEIELLFFHGVGVHPKRQCGISMPQPRGLRSP